MHRNLMAGRSTPANGSFSTWMEKQNNPDLPEEEEVAIFTQMKNINDSLGTQLLELSGSLPDAGPLSAAFRQRVQYAIYCLLGCVFFAILAIVIGLPTLILKPSKFVRFLDICLWL